MRLLLNFRAMWGSLWDLCEDYGGWEEDVHYTLGIRPAPGSDICGPHVNPCQRRHGVREGTQA